MAGAEVETIPGLGGARNPPSCSPAEFKLLRDYLYATTGIAVPEKKLALIEGRLAKRLRILGLKSYRQYYHHLLESDGDKKEFSEFINALTTNKTDFFREEVHFQRLVKDLLPARVAWRKERGQRSLRLWSAACSSGEEPYTLGMHLIEFVEREKLADWDARILGTDIDSKILAKAERGVYGLDRITGVPLPYRQRFFKSITIPGRIQRPALQVGPELKNLVRFRRFNLMVDEYPFNRGFDVVFCRNVMIYFDQKGRERVVRQITRHLCPGGYLVIGHSESLLGVSHTLKVAGPTVFQKTE